MHPQKKHTCEAACGQCGIIQVETRPGKPPSKQKYMKDARDAHKKQATARQKAGAKPYEAGKKVRLPRAATPSTEKQIKDFVYPERWGGPRLSARDREELCKIVGDAYWRGGFVTTVRGVHAQMNALKAAGVVVDPWKYDWFQGFIDGPADAKERRADAARANGAKEKEEAEERFDEDFFPGMSETHAAHYARLAKKLANEVADRDNKPRPSPSEIRKNPHYSVWKSNFKRLTPSTRLVDFHTGTTGSTSRTAPATPAPAACGSSAVEAAACASWSGSSTGTGARTTASCPTPPPATSATRGAARADATAAALHAHDATYTRVDAGALADGRLALMGRGSDDDAAARLARVRAATSTRSADDAALVEAHVSTPARDRGDGVERFDPATRDRAPRAAPLKPCPACSAMIPGACRTCPKCRKPCTKKRRSS